MLKGIINDDFFEIKAIFTHYYETDMKSIRPLYKEFVKISEENSIPLIQIHKDHDKLEALENLKFDFLISNCYKYIIPEKYLNCAKICSLNMHRSLLPKYKGLKPLKRALENNEKETGTSIHIMTKDVDAGPIIDQDKIVINEGDDEKKLFEKLYPIQYPLLKRALIKILEKK